MTAAWTQRLATEADGLDFTDPDDRATFRQRVADAASMTRRHVLVTVMANLDPHATPRATNAALVRQIADAHIAEDDR